jgi:hypothetical protein
VNESRNFRQEVKMKSTRKKRFLVPRMTDRQSSYLGMKVFVMLTKEAFLSLRSTPKKRFLVPRNDRQRILVLGMKAFVMLTKEASHSLRSARKKRFLVPWNDRRRVLLCGNERLCHADEGSIPLAQIHQQEEIPRSSE